MGICTSNSDPEMSNPDQEEDPEEKDDSHKVKHEKAVKYGLEVMQQGFVKVDHFENIYRIDPKFEGAPNLRQVSGFNIYGTGQPNKSAIISLLDIWFNKMENLDKCLWVNMRSEPVLYVKDISLAPRDPKHPSENIDFGEEGIITIDDLDLFNIELEKVVKQNIDATEDKIFTYHKDTYAPLPADRKDMVLTFQCENGSNDVYSLQSLYNDELAKKQGLNIHLQRITVLDEKAPEPDDIVKIVNVVTKQSDDKTVIVFNCQMGKGRTTEGMIMACLIKQIMGQKIESQDDGGYDAGLWPNDVPANSEEEVSFQRKLAKKKEQQQSQEEPVEDSTDEEKDGLSVKEMKCGNFTLIKKLMDILNNEYKLNGDKIKQETDDIIDRCQHLTNMRECIYLAKQRYIAETRQNQRGYWQKMAKQFLQRYYVLIVFNAYLNDVILEQSKSVDDIDYIQWMKTKPLIDENIGTLKDGDLSKFNWD